MCLLHHGIEDATFDCWYNNSAQPGLAPLPAKSALMTIGTGHGTCRRELVSGLDYRIPDSESGGAPCYGASWKMDM